MLVYYTRRNCVHGSRFTELTKRVKSKLKGEEKIIIKLPTN